MREMDSIGLKLCQFQADLFVASIDLKDCSSGIFIRRFMNSDLAKRLDNTGIIFESISLPDALDELDEQYGVSNYGSQKYTAEEIRWIGYIYRYWVYAYDISSKNLYKKIKPEQLRKVYFPYHSLDPRQAIERIAEEQGITLQNDWSDIAKGVAAMRRVIKKLEEKNKKRVG